MTECGASHKSIPCYIQMFNKNKLNKNINVCITNVITNVIAGEVS